MSSEARRIVRLAACATFQEGYVNPSQRDPGYFGDDYKWLRATDLNDGFVFNTSRGLSAKGFASAGKSALLFAPNTLAISKSGTIGRVGILKDFMCGNRAVINIKVNPDCDTRFIFYTLILNRQKIESLAEGSVQKNLYVSSLGRLEFELPSLPEQVRISETIGALDDRIALLRETNATLEAIAQAMFKSWFVDFDPVHANAKGRAPEGMSVAIPARGTPVCASGVPPDPSAAAALFPDSFEESELGLVPRGWKVGELGDVFALRNERTKPSSQTAAMPYVPIEAISAKMPFLQEYKSGEEANSSLIIFREGDILFGAMRPYFHKVCVAPFDGVTRTTVFVLTAKNQHAKPFALFLAYQDTTVEYATQHSEGSTIPYAKWNNSLERMPVVLPPEDVQMCFSNVVSAFIERANANIKQAQTLATLRDTLLPRLISGQLRIENIEGVV